MINPNKNTMVLGTIIALPKSFDFLGSIKIATTHGTIEAYGKALGFNPKRFKVGDEVKLRCNYSIASEALYCNRLTKIHKPNKKDDIMSNNVIQLDTSKKVDYVWSINGKVDKNWRMGSTSSLHTINNSITDQLAESFLYSATSSQERLKRIRTSLAKINTTMAQIRELGNK